MIITIVNLSSIAYIINITSHRSDAAANADYGATGRV
jgi:hypothetical protein